MYSSLLIVFFTATICNCEITRDQFIALRKKCSRQVIKGQGDNLPTTIRLAFHDCVGTGGCNGCVDHNNVDNAGLKDRNDAVIAAYNSSDVDSSLLSLADFVALCGVEAVEQAFRNSYKGKARFQFKTGRVTKDNCTGDNDNQFPSPLAGYTDTMTWLKTQFGLKDDREATVLLGAHTMGETHAQHSGHRGPWTSNPHVLNNEYYKVIIDAQTENWHQVDVGVGKWQWQQPGQNSVQKRDVREGPIESKRKRRQAAERLMMLNADMSLYRNLSVDTSGISVCADNVSSCADSPGKATVEYLAANNDAFIEEFIVAFTKMIEQVPAGVQLVPVKDPPESSCFVVSPNILLISAAVFAVLRISQRIVSDQ